MNIYPDVQQCHMKTNTDTCNCVVLCFGSQWGQVGQFMAKRPVLLHPAVITIIITWTESKQLTPYAFHNTINMRTDTPPPPPPQTSNHAKSLSSRSNPCNPKIILVNSGHSSGRFHPETAETEWGLVGSWRSRVGVLSIHIIGWAVFKSRKTSTGF